MDHSGEKQLARRRFLASGLSLLGCGLTVASAGLLSGCDDKGTMTHIENAPDPAQKAKDSMDYYMQKKGAAGKKK